MKEKTMKTISVFLLAVVAAVCFWGMMYFAPVRAEEPTPILMAEGASVRYKTDEETDRSGLRFTAYVSEAYKSANETAEYGMLLIPADVLGEEELTAESSGAANKAAEVWFTESDKDGYAKFTTVLYNIPETEYGRVIAARAYIKQRDAYTYSATEKRSVAQVASYALAAGDEHKEELNAYVDSAVKSFTVEENLTLKKGDTAKAEVAIEPAELTPMYHSENETVVSVAADGTVTANTYGEAKITVTLGSTVKTISVSVPTPEGVFSDFSDASFVDEVSKGVDTYWQAATFDPEYVDEIAGTNDGAVVVTMTANTNKLALVRVNFRKAILESDRPDGLIMRFKLEGASVYGMKSAGVSGFYFENGNTKIYNDSDGWMFIKIGSGTSNFGGTIEGFDILLWKAEAGGTVTFALDYISNYAGVGEVLAENEYADFSSASYIFGVSAIGHGDWDALSRTVNYVSPADGCDDGKLVVELKTRKVSYNTGLAAFKLQLRKPIEKSTVTSITVRIKYDKLYAVYFSGGSVDTANLSGVTQGEADENGWRVLTISNSVLKQESVSEIYFMFAGAEEGSTLTIELDYIMAE